jgi:hypothetical protein
MHQHQNAELTPEPLRGTGLLASHIDSTVDMETPMCVSYNIKNAYTQEAKNAQDTSIIIHRTPTTILSLSSWTPPRTLKSGSPPATMR